MFVGVKVRVGVADKTGVDGMDVLVAFVGIAVGKLGTVAVGGNGLEVAVFVGNGVLVELGRAAVGLAGRVGIVAPGVRKISIQEALVRMAGLSG